jgi:hypothetical protein
MAQPATIDVRVSCPACGGAIHPIAGRCKHCRADLVAVRGGATGALGAVIEIGSLAVAAPQSNRANTASAVSSPSLFGSPSLLGSSTAVSAPVIFSSVSTGARSSQGAWKKRWPLLVAGLAALAIVVSIAVLLFGSGKKTRHRRALGPAPDRMQTDQLPTDPWSNRGSGPTPNPDQMQPIPQTPAPDIAPGRGSADPSDPSANDDDPDDPASGAPSQPAAPSAAGPRPTSADAFMSAAIDVACTRLTACWGGGAATSMCDQIKSLSTQATRSCQRYDADAADQCLRSIGHIPCPDADVPLSEMLGMVAGIDSCMHACQ